MLFLRGQSNGKVVEGVSRIVDGQIQIALSLELTELTVRGEKGKVTEKVIMKAKLFVFFLGLYSNHDNKSMMKEKRRK